MIADRDQLVALVERLMSGDYTSDEEVDGDAAEFEASVPRPGALGLIYYWEDEFDHEPTVEEVVDRAMNYRSMEL